MLWRRRQAAVVGQAPPARRAAARCFPDATKFSHGVLPIDYTGARSTKCQQSETNGSRWALKSLSYGAALTGWDLSGENDLSEQASTTVRIPERNLFDVEGLHHLMERARRSNG